LEFERNITFFLFKFSIFNFFCDEEGRMALTYQEMLALLQKSDEEERERKSEGKVHECADGPQMLKVLRKLAK
jgi:hypothetical protein